MTSVYDSERLAASYAFNRPPIHEQILRSARLTRHNAIARGAYRAEKTRDWCQETLKAVFADGDVTVIIPGYVATLAAGERPAILPELSTIFVLYGYPCFVVLTGTELVRP